MAYQLTEKLWYTADKKSVVPDGDPRAAFLLGLPGRLIGDDEAVRLGLVANEPKPTEEKAAEPAANKAKRKPANKGKRGR